ncbi:hypothetical protein ACOSP7_013117 [Xanthoceras sorbifolium]
MGNGVKVEAEYIGVTRLLLSSGHILELNDTLYIPSIMRNLIFVSLLDRAGFTFHFGDGKVLLYRDNVYIDSGTLCNGLYMIELIPNFAQSSFTVNHKIINYKTFYKTYLQIPCICMLSESIYT